MIATRKRALEMRDDGATYTQIADELGCAVSTAYRWCRTGQTEHGHRWDAHMAGGRWFYDCHRCTEVVEGPATMEDLTSECEAEVRGAA